MRRALTVAFVAGLFLAPMAPASAADPIDDATRVVERFVGVRPGGIVPPIYGPVVGYIAISNAASPTPVVTLHGALADPTQWTCTIPSYDPAAPYTVGCTPAPNVVLTWECAILHADATTHEAGSLARASMDCDGDGSPEAQATAQGATYPDGSARTFSSSNVTVTEFRCTLDDAAGGPALGRWTIGCGDPGAPHL